MKTLSLLTMLMLLGGATAANAINGTTPSYRITMEEPERVIANGIFQRVDNRHDISGSVEIKDTANGLMLVLSEDFMVSEGPLLQIIARDSTGAMPMRMLAPLQMFQGGQDYMLNLTEAELAMYDRIYIYCAEFHVDFGFAAIRN